MFGDLDPYDKADPPLGREFGYLNDCQEPQSQLLKRTDNKISIQTIPGVKNPLHDFATWWGTHVSCT